MIIFLNGTSSSGKTSLAKELQKLSDKPLLHVGIDTLYNMIPPQLIGHDQPARDGVFYEMVNKRLKQVHIGPVAEKLLRCTVPLVAELLRHGSDLVIDEILFAGEGRDFLYQYAYAFEGYQAYFVRVECGIEELERREVGRPDRHKGIAALQYANVHNHGYAYDITVDTAGQSPEEGARELLTAIDAMPEPQAFEVIRDSE